MASASVSVGVPLSLSGAFARFGEQARRGLLVWQSFQDDVDLVIEDDRSDPDTLEHVLRRLARRCDLLLGPYSTRLARRAGDLAAASGLLLWNHGGSGDDVERAHPGHVVSVPTPASRYADPFVRHLAASGRARHLWIVRGRGSFGRQVTAGAESAARSIGLSCTRGERLPGEIDGPWSLFCAGTFEEDVETVRQVRERRTPPVEMCAVAAGVREFGAAVAGPEGIYGVAQWAPGVGRTAEVGVPEPDFLARYAALAGGPPDYPAVQAVAAATIATHCLALAGGTEREALWSAASTLDTTTLFGPFRIDPGTGLQTGHQALLTRWTPTGPIPQP
ncbi:ABC transporter substrate-binding protein [Nonomuraea jiangxiensis]|uniref:ABC-type branched-chain amino acid transport system, substrate-binding protein n=1 Tax=Nonomuraea jiangxiensis TaxID=633440 RepID=A0A1G8BNF2_9ACTN|nr:ABC transporter substrate-binding protein [Nonomuraea jiangxiensis]SDH34663.1 ABC-type branched-chain amino acid transport system, substrate-binding protein [Nonomuraea jiangxiensis]